MRFKRKKSILIFATISLLVLSVFSSCGKAAVKTTHKIESSSQHSQHQESSLIGNIEITPNTNANVNENNTPQDQIQPAKVQQQAQPQPQISQPPAAQQPTVPNTTQPKMKKVAYLTFDDGPSGNVTPQMLDTLKKYGVKATFFLIGKNTIGNEAVVKRIKLEGHTIGNHSYTHDDKRLYSDFEYFKSDFNECNETLTKILGEGGYSKIYRFPRGEYGHHKRERAFVEGQGFKIYDWNCLSYDAELPENKTPQQLLENIKTTSRGKNNLIVLMHTSTQRQNSADALPSIIEYLKGEEYSFDVL